MQQDAFHLVILFGGFMSVFLLPVTIGIIAVIRERE